MSKIYFGKNIKTKSGNFSDVFKGDFKNNLTDVYSLPSNLVNISNIFNGCANLKKVGYELENTLQDISSAFRGCKNIEQDMNIPYSVVNGAYAFSGTNIKNAHFVSFGSDEQTEDLSYCFLGCDSLDTVTGVIPSTIKNLKGCFKDTVIRNTPVLHNNCYNLYDASEMFQNCMNMYTTGIQFPISSNNLYMKNTFFNCKKLNSYEYDINAYDVSNIFYGCDNLKKVGNINADIQINSFKNCKFSDINLSGSVFKNTLDTCSNLKNINITTRGYLDSISANHYSVALDNFINNCDNIYNLNIIPSDVNIPINNGNSYFFINQDFTKLDQNAVIRIWGNHHSIETERNIRNQLNSNDRCYYQSNYFVINDFMVNGGNGLTRYIGNNVNLYLPNYIRTDIHNPNTQTHLSYYNNCFSNTDIDTVITDHELTIGEYSFYNSNIKNFIAPNLVVTNKNSFFENAQNLTQVQIKQFENIANNCFKNCVSLKKIYNESYKPYTVTDVGQYGFYECRNIVDNSINKNFYNLREYALYNTRIQDLDIKTFVSTSALYSASGRNSVNMHVSYYSKDIGYYVNYLYLSGSPTIYSNGNTAFAYSGLNHVIFTQPNVYFINNCFKSTGLNTLKICNGCESIAREAFYNMNISYIDPVSLQYIMSATKKHSNSFLGSPVFNTSPTYYGNGYNVINLRDDYSDIRITTSSDNIIFIGTNYTVVKNNGYVLEGSSISVLGNFKTFNFLNPTTEMMQDPVFQAAYNVYQQYGRIDPPELNQI